MEGVAPAIRRFRMHANLRIIKLGWSSERPANAFLLHTMEDGKEVRVWAKWQVLVEYCRIPEQQVWKDVQIEDEQQLFRRYDIPNRFSGLPFTARIPGNLTGDTGPAAIHAESEAAARQFDDEFPNSPVDKFYMGYRTAARKYKPDAVVAKVYAGQVQNAAGSLTKARELVDALRSKIRKNKWIKRRLKTVIAHLDELRAHLE